MGGFWTLFVFSIFVFSSCGDGQQMLKAEVEGDATSAANSSAAYSSTVNSSEAESQLIFARENALRVGSNPLRRAEQFFSTRETSESIYCPTGSWYSTNEKLCVTESQAIGPFTREMIALCKKYGGGSSSCDGSRWSRSFAAQLRATEVCPRGALFDESRQGCVEGNEVFGPFKVREVDACRSRSGGRTCESMRWNLGFLPQKIQSATANKKLLSFYGVRANYDDVFEDVLSFYPQGRRNGCVAFMSAALRRSGTTVPVTGYVNGESVSLVTKPFSQYLQDRLGWKKITAAKNLQPGDVVLTEDDARYPGYPAHTYMFYGWSNQRSGIGWVIDNQDFIHERNIFGYGTYNFTPFAYALRSPE